MCVCVVLNRAGSHQLTECGPGLDNCHSYSETFFLLMRVVEKDRKGTVMKLTCFNNFTDEDLGDSCHRYDDV